MNAKADAMARIVERQFFAASIRLHILQQAGRGKVFGVGLIEELRRQGYRLSPGTLYPLLHSLEQNGYLRSSVQIIGGRQCRFYVATSTGNSALHRSRPRIVALMRQLCENDSAGRRLKGRAGAKQMRGRWDSEPREGK